MRINLPAIVHNQDAGHILKGPIKMKLKLESLAGLVRGCIVAAFVAIVLVPVAMSVTAAALV